MAPSQLGSNEDTGLQVLSEDGGRIFCRGCRGDAADSNDVLAVFAASAQSRPATVDRLARDYTLKDEGDGTWAMHPRALVQDRSRTIPPFETFVICIKRAQRSIAQRSGMYAFTG